jgi:hypothetical protein
MRLLTIKGGWGRNRYFEINNGSVRILRDGQQQETTLTVKDGQITEVEDIEYPAGSPGERIVTTKDWNQTERPKAGMIRTVSRYESCWNLPIREVFHEVHGIKIGRYKGTLRQLSRRGRFVREEFVYANGRQAYVWTPYRRSFRLYRPAGRLWMEVTAKLRPPWKRTEGLLEKVQAILENIAGDGHTWSRQPDYEIKLYDGLGRQSGFGNVSNRQRVGIWQHGRARHYFMIGVAVSKETFYADPDDLDPLEVLRTENAQLRAALMKKIGPERLLQKLPFTACDTDGDNRLLKADVNSLLTPNDELAEPVRARNGFDEQVAIAVLKCPSTGQLYYLRVPPRLNKVEHARQWLCGIDIEGLEEEYIRDMWTRPLGGAPVSLTPSAQKSMEAELSRAAQRQRLEFVSEA